MTCPHCGSESAWRNGHRNGLQRYLCKVCGREFVEPALTQTINRPEPNLLLVGEAEKLPKTGVCGEADAEKGEKMSEQVISEKSDLLKDFPEGLQAKILEFAVRRENNNCKDVQHIVYCLRQLIKLGANLYDPENVKELLKKMSVQESTKNLYAAHYEAFLKFLGGSWERPKYVQEEKTPFVPLETEIDQLIAGLSNLIAAFCQVLKETAARAGEVTEIRWTEVDFEKRLIYINHPEKGSKTGVYGVSEKCVNLVKQLPRKGDKIFISKKSVMCDFTRQRKRLAYKLNNPRLNEIRLHTFRHWKGTIEAYKTRDPFHVQRILRHKNLQNTQKYIHLAEAMFNLMPDDEYTVKVADSKEEAVKLLEVGFQYIGNILGCEMFKKRK